MDLTLQTASFLNNIVAQFSALSWTMILSAVGFSEVWAYRQSQLPESKTMPWYFAPLLGAIIGTVQTLSEIKFGTDGFFHCTFLILKSVIIYGGLTPVVYLIILKPFKSFVALLQSKTDKGA